MGDLLGSILLKTVIFFIGIFVLVHFIWGKFLLNLIALHVTMPVLVVAGGWLLMALATYVLSLMFHIKKLILYIKSNQLSEENFNIIDSIVKNYNKVECVSVFQGYTGESYVYFVDEKNEGYLVEYNFDSLSLLKLNDGGEKYSVIANYRKSLKFGDKAQILFRNTNRIANRKWKDYKKNDKIVLIVWGSIIGHKPFGLGEIQ